MNRIGRPPYSLHTPDCIDEATRRYRVTAHVRVNWKYGYKIVYYAEWEKMTCNFFMPNETVNTWVLWKRFSTEKKALKFLCKEILKNKRGTIICK